MGIPTYTNLIKENIIKNYLGSNLVVVLINNPNLGITDSPTVQQLNARRNLTMIDVFNTEIGGNNLNGYARAIVNNSNINPIIVNTDLTEAEINVSFTAVGGVMGPFSHIVVVRGANVSGANPLTNGNNRGDTTGNIIFIEPITNNAAPETALSILNGATFDYTFKLISSSEII